MPCEQIEYSGLGVAQLQNSRSEVLLVHHCNFLPRGRGGVAGSARVGLLDNQHWLAAKRVEPQ